MERVSCDMNLKIDKMQFIIRFVYPFSYEEHRFSAKNWKKYVLKCNRLFQVKGEDEKPLPQWLIFDKESSVLEGVPSENDIGDIQVNVKAFDSRGHFVSDVFVIEVYPLLEKNTNDKVKNFFSVLQNLFIGSKTSV